MHVTTKYLQLVSNVIVNPEYFSLYMITIKIMLYLSLLSSKCPKEHKQSIDLNWIQGKQNQ